MNSFFRLVTGQPQLLVDHVQAYAELAGAEITRLSIDCKRRVLLSAVALCALLAAVMLAGVALMLWAVTAEPGASHWLLIVTPAVPALVAACCWAALRIGRVGASTGALRQQVEADLLLWRATTGAA